MYIRKKGAWKDGESKYIIEEIVRGKTIYIKTVPPAKELIKLLSQDGLSVNPSQNKGDLGLNTPEKFVYDKLSEPLEQDKKRKISTEENKFLYELTKE